MSWAFQIMYLPLVNLGWHNEKGGWRGERWYNDGGTRWECHWWHESMALDTINEHKLDNLRNSATGFPHLLVCLKSNYLYEPNYQIVGVQTNFFNFTYRLWVRLSLSTSRLKFYLFIRLRIFVLNFNSSALFRFIVGFGLSLTCYGWRRRIMIYSIRDF